MHSKWRLDKASKQMVSRLRQMCSACEPSWKTSSAKLNRSALLALAVCTWMAERPLQGDFLSMVKVGLI